MSPSAPASGWTLHYLGDEGALYVYLCPPRDQDHPMAFPLASLTSEHRAQLRSLVRGDAVPEGLMVALLKMATPRPLSPLP